MTKLFLRCFPILKNTFCACPKVIKPGQNIFFPTCLGIVLLISSPAFAGAASTFAQGADVSWLTQMESQGILFYNNAGVQQDCFQILQGKCINAIRLRVWVNPAGGWCGQTDVVNKATRAPQHGFPYPNRFPLQRFLGRSGPTKQASGLGQLYFRPIATGCKPAYG